MTRNWIGGAVALALVAGGVGFGAARLLDTRGGHAEEADHAEGEAAHGEAGFIALTPAQAQAAGVVVTTLQRGGGTDILLPGRVGVAPNASAALGAPVAGTVERVHVAPGQEVRQGAAIATVRSAEGAASRASVDASAAGARAAQAAAARDKRLFEAGVVARQDWEASQANAARAEAELRAARAQVAAQGQPGAGGVAVLRSPIGGVVTRVETRVGGFVTQGSLVAEIVDARAGEYVFEAPPAAADAIRPGQAVRVQLPDGSETTATIAAVAPSAAGSGAATVRARASGPTPPPGSVVSARVVMRAGAGGLVVPSEAVQTLEGRSVIFVSEAKGFRAVPVVAGRTAGGQTEVLKGLKGDERIAGKGAFLLKAEAAKGEAGDDH